MKLSQLLICSVLFLTSCSNNKKDDGPGDTKSLADIFEEYFEQRLQLFPLEATSIGDTRYNDLLPLEFTDSYRAKLLEFYNRYLAAVRKYDREKLNEKDKLNFDVFVYTTNMNIEELGFSSNNIPFNQYYALPLSLGQMGSGEGSQPFKTAKDYEDWLKRAAGFKAWSDTAILYFQKGLNAQYVLPKSLVVKMIPQMKAMVSSDITTSVFYGPVKNMPASFSDSVKQHFTTAYTKLIRETLEPAYTKLANFLEKNYLPLARTTSGISALPGGNDYYKFLVRQQTTTSQTPEEIYNTGLKEVARIKALMDSVKNSTGFAGDLNSFFAYMTTDK